MSPSAVGSHSLSLIVFACLFHSSISAPLVSSIILSVLDSEEAQNGTESTDSTMDTSNNDTISISTAQSSTTGDEEGRSSTTIIIGSTGTDPTIVAAFGAWVPWLLSAAFIVLGFIPSFFILQRRHLFDEILEAILNQEIMDEVMEYLKKDEVLKAENLDEIEMARVDASSKKEPAVAKGKRSSDHYTKFLKNLIQTNSAKKRKHLQGRQRKSIDISSSDGSKSKSMAKIPSTTGQVQTKLGKVSKATKTTTGGKKVGCVVVDKGKKKSGS